MAQERKQGIRIILELPANLALDPNTLGVINDRIRDINADFAISVISPSLDDVDMGKHKIVNLADPKNDLDAVNLRTLRQSGSGNAAVSEQQISTAGGLDAYAIVFSKDGNVNDGDQAPGYPVHQLRQGIPVAVGVMAIQAGAGDFNGNIAINLGDGSTPPTNVLNNDIVLPAGQLGPVWVKADYKPRVKQGGWAYIVIDKGGGLGGPTLVLVMKRFQ